MAGIVRSLITLSRRRNRAAPQIGASLGHTAARVIMPFIARSRRPPELSVHNCVHFPGLPKATPLITVLVTRSLPKGRIQRQREESQSYNCMWGMVAGRRGCRGTAPYFIVSRAAVNVIGGCGMSLPATESRKVRSTILCTRKRRLMKPSPQESANLAAPPPSASLVSPVGIEPTTY
jgi:hypothetical protein